MSFNECDAVDVAMMITVALLLLCVGRHVPAGLLRLGWTAAGSRDESKAPWEFEQLWTDNDMPSYDLVSKWVCV